MKEYREDDLDTRPKKELPIEVYRAIVLGLVLAVIFCFVTAVWALK